MWYLVLVSFHELALSTWTHICTSGKSTSAVISWFRIAKLLVIHCFADFTTPRTVMAMENFQWNQHLLHKSLFVNQVQKIYFFHFDINKQIRSQLTNLPIAVTLLLKHNYYLIWFDFMNIRHKQAKLKHKNIWNAKSLKVTQGDSHPARKATYKEE